MSRVYRLVFTLLCSLIAFGCSCERNSVPSKTGESASFSPSSLPELEALAFPITKPYPLLFVDASKEASGLYALEGEDEDEALRRADPNVSFDPLIARALYEQVGDEGDPRVRIRGVLYTAESESAWAEPPVIDRDPDALNAADNGDDEAPRAPSSADQGAEAPLEAGDAIAELPDAEPVLQRGAFGRQRVLRFDDNGLAAAPVTVSRLDQGARDLRRSTSFSTYSLDDSASSAVVHRAEPAHAVRASMGEDDAHIVFPPGYVIAAAASAEMEEHGWFVVSEKTLQVLDDELRVVGIVHDSKTGKALTDVTNAAFVSQLGDGGVLATLKREGAASELYYLSALELVPDEPAALETDAASQEGGSDKPADSKAEENQPSSDEEELRPSEPKPPQFRATVERLQNEDGKALEMSVLGGGGLGLPATQHRVLRDDALYFAYGPGTMSGQWTRIHRASRDGWTVFDHKIAEGFAPNEAVWGAIRSALSPFLFDAEERGLFLALGEKAVFLDVSAKKGADWKLTSLETPLPKLKTAVTNDVSEGWVYMNGSHRPRLRAPSADYAVALNLRNGEAIVLVNTRWLGAVSDGRYLRPFRPELLRVSAMIGIDGEGQLFVVSADSPEAGRVTLGALPQGTKEVHFFGISIGPRRLLQLIGDDGRTQIAVVDVRNPDSMRIVSEKPTEGWRFQRVDEAEATGIAIPAKSTRPLSGF